MNGQGGRSGRHRRGSGVVRSRRRLGAVAVSRPLYQLKAEFLKTLGHPGAHPGAATAAAVVYLHRLGRDPQRSRILIADADRMPVLSALLIATGFPTSLCGTAPTAPGSPCAARPATPTWSSTCRTSPTTAPSRPRQPLRSPTPSRRRCTCTSRRPPTTTAGRDSSSAAPSHPAPLSGQHPEGVA